MEQLIKLSQEHDHIAIITLNRPEAANAMSNSLLHQLNQILQKVNEDTAINATIITNAGEKAFCAGADLKERKNMTNEQVIETVAYIGKTVNAIEHLRMPVIAAINGAAYGGGLELALACDIRIASQDTKLGLTETSLAIVPGAGGTQRLPRLVGLGHAKRLIYSAKPITAAEALNIGLVEQIFKKENLLNEAIKLAESIAANGPIAIEQAKLAINTGMQTNLLSGLAIEHEAYKKTIPTEDRLEGLHAFSEKRRPRYQGK
ncbi:enoyl-CoA hydratase [Oceanobacillus chungangensis]|uniref:Enoyl-CoA hydratase n=1 Tax=Oceanobacillus chungangensis TaxID=1229152 RepID=A0A3D8PNP5_9BACI|nr:enoyl-CoA hydratase [Oceanobacillus chungangensis]RDW17733.1 enoyl-CoA hydratase [Oceanobacillus chungangensis]